MLRVQRLMFLTVCKGYRTVSKESKQVLTGILPIDLKALGRRDLYRNRREGRNRATEIRQHYLDKWQERWDRSEMGRALLLLMPDVGERVK